MKSPRVLLKTALALVVAGALWTFIYQYEFIGEQAREEALAAEKKVFMHDFDDVSGLEITSGSMELSLLKESGDWRIKAPLETRADPDKVRAILSDLEYLEISEQFEEVGEEELGGFNLVEPAATVTLRLSGAEEQAALSIGDKAPVRGGYYALRPDSRKVLVVSGSLGDLLAANPESLRYRKLVGADLHRVRRLSIVKGDSRLSVTRVDDDWRLEEPFSFPADGSKIGELWRELQGVEAEAFESEQPSIEELVDLGLSPPRLSLRVEEQEEADPLTLEFGPSGLARRSDMTAVMRIGTGALEKLEQVVSNVRELRDARVAPFDRFRLSGIEIRRAGSTILLEKDERSRWRWGSLDGAEVQSEKVNALLDAVEELEGVDFIDSPPDGTSGAAVTMTLREGHDADSRQVVLNLLERAAAEETRRITSTASEATYLVPAGAVEALLEGISGVGDEPQPEERAPEPAGEEP